MINAVRLRNFKSFIDTEKIPFSPITLFSGQNSSGKSSLIQALLVLKQTLESPITEESVILNGSYVSLGEYEDVKSSITEKNENISIGVDLGFYKSKDDDIRKVGYFNRFFNSVEKINFNLELSDPYRFDQEEGYGYNGPRLIRSSIDGIVDGKKFDFAVRSNKDFKSKLQSIYNYGDDLDDIGYLFEVEKCVNFSYRPEAVIFNTFLPQGILRPYHKELLDEQNKFVMRLLHNLYRVFGQKIPNSSTKYTPETWSGLIRRLRIFTNDAGEYNQDKLNEILQKFEQIMVDRKDLKDFDDINNFKLILSRMSNQTYDEIDRLFEEEKLIINRMKNMRRTLELEHIRRLALQTEKHYIDLEDINQIVKNSFAAIYYLGPLREEPRAYYRRLGSNDPMYVGQKGENVAFVIKYHSQKKMSVVLPPIEDIEWNPQGANIEQIRLGHAIKSWLKYLGVANEIKVEEMGKLGLTIRANIHGDKDADLTNVGVGVSQVLPIIVMGLCSPQNAVLVLEQPELHLHPYVQSRLGDFFVALSRMGKQVIAETHSEHLIHRLRYHIAKGNLNNSEDISVYFCHRDDGMHHSVVSKINIDQYGSISNWPKGFFDETNKLLESILMAALEREDLY